MPWVISQIYTFLWHVTTHDCSGVNSKFKHTVSDIASNGNYLPILHDHVILYPCLFMCELIQWIQCSHSAKHSTLEIHLATIGFALFLSAGQTTYVISRIILFNSHMFSKHQFFRINRPHAWVKLAEVLHHGSLRGCFECKRRACWFNANFTAAILA